MTDGINRLIKIPISIVDTLWQLFKDGPTWDGNLISKENRNWLVENGYADRRNGWNFLTSEGVQLALDSNLNLRKEQYR